MITVFKHLKNCHVENVASLFSAAQTVGSEPIIQIRKEILAKLQKELFGSKSCSAL